ncbi:MAG: 2-hydroxyacid dehydrogenase [Acetobacteraceae bacterium]
MSYKVAFLDLMDPKVHAEIRGALPPDFTIQFGETGERSEQMAMIADADFILTAVAVDAEMIRSAPKLKLLHKWGIGVDKFDLDAARAARLPVAITAGANAGAVSEHTVMLMLATYRHLALSDRKLRQGQWIRPQIRGMAYQLSGKTVGILGFGNVGRMVAHRLAGFDVEILYHDIRRADRATEKSLRVTPVTLDELLTRSDVLTLHTPLTKVTRGIINADAIARMKTGAILINAARGEVVDEGAVYDALVSGKLRGAGLDVFHQEPADPNNPLFKLDQVVVTPHTAGSAIDLVGDIARHAFSNMEAVLRGDPLSPNDVIVAAGENK